MFLSARHSPPSGDSGGQVPSILWLPHDPQRALEGCHIIQSRRKKIMKCLLVSFIGSGLELAQVTSSRILLATPQSENRANCKGGWEMKFAVCPGRKGNRPVFTTDSSDVILSFQQLHNLHWVPLLYKGIILARVTIYCVLLMSMMLHEYYLN